jgi:hypothetical protein
MMIMINKNILYFAAAATTAIAGILHLVIVPNVMGFSTDIAIFFVMSGIAQLFWVIPMSRRWGRLWYYIGLAGTVVLIIMWVVTRMPNNPITGRGGQVSEIGIAIEVLQVAFIIITAAILAMERKNETSSKQSSPT